MSLSSKWRTNSSRRTAKVARYTAWLSTQKPKAWGVGELYDKIMHPSCSSSSIVVDLLGHTLTTFINQEELLSFLMYTEQNSVDAIVLILDDHSYHIHLEKQ